MKKRTKKKKNPKSSSGEKTAKLKLSKKDRKKVAHYVADILKTHLKKNGKKVSKSDSFNLSKLLDQPYPEFGNLKGGEILTRLQAFEQMSLNYPQAQTLSLDSQITGPDEDIYSVSKKVKNSDDLKNFRVIAHRGWSGSYPENTLIGMREAITLGCHMIEFDVTLTRDQRVIIIHDNDLSRTTNGVGLVSEQNFADLRKLDAGSWFHPKYKGARLPTLEEVLLISKSTGIQVNIEIKKESWDEEEHKKNIEKQVVKSIRRYNVADRVVISSFRWSFIERIHRDNPDIKTALLHYKDVGKLNVKKLKQKYGMYSFNPHSIDLTQKFVDTCHENDVLVFPFTINNYQDMEKYFNMKVDGMFTNHPNRLFRFIEKQNMKIKKFREMEELEDVQDLQSAIQKMEAEEMEKARKRARWRAKRRILENLKEE